MVAALGVQIYQDSYMSIKIFNNLPKFLVDLLEDETVFVERLKEILMHNVFYSVEGFLNYCQKK
jgi:hypothetical protein